MPVTLKDNAGNDVEVSTPEELEVETAELIEQAKQEAKTEFESQVKAKEDEIEKLKDQVGNFKNLREKTQTQEEQEVELKDRLAKVEGELQETKESATKAVNNHFLDTEIARIAGGDEKFKEQIKANIDILNMPSSTAEEIVKKVKKATINAQIDMGQMPDDSAFTGMNISAGGGSQVQNTKNNLDTEEIKAQAAGFGISEEKLKKYNKI
jgi:molybdopterin converting factor small subunit